MAKHPCLGFLAVVAIVLALPLQSFALPRQMEALDRGLVVANVGKSGMLVSWRLLGTEKSDTEFNRALRILQITRAAYCRIPKGSMRRLLRELRHGSGQRRG